MTLAVASSTRARKAPAKAPQPVLAPFTLDHFRWWLSERQLTFDNDAPVVLEQFQERFVSDVFAGKAECWLIVPEGNGKTTLIALLSLYHAEFRPHAAVSVAASSREQAEILYRQAEGFVLRSKSMQQTVTSPVAIAKGKRKTDVPRFLCLEGYRRINHFEGGRIQVFAADDRTGDGQIPTLGVLDELHRHRDLGLYRTWAGKLQKRGGQIITISTAGEPGSDFETTREKIRQTAGEVIRQGSFVRAESPRLVLHEYAVPEKGDVSDMGVVKAANPFSGVTVDTLREKYDSPTMTLEHWTRFSCNVPTRASNSAIGESEWANALSKTEIPRGVSIDLGLDYAPKWDTTALVPLWWKSETFRQFGKPAILTPPRDNSIIDQNLIERALVLIHERNPIATVVMDPSRAQDLAQWIRRELKAEVIEWPQTNPQKVEDFERFMEALSKKWLWHSGDTEFTRHVLNAVARILPFGDTRFDRPSQTRQSAEQERRVIDGLDAGAMVHSFAARQYTKPKRAPLFARAA